MPVATRTAALVAVSLLLAGCRMDAPGATPDGYHRMPDGTLMADVTMTAEYRDLSGNGVLVLTHTRPDGTVVLGGPPDHANGDHGGHDHPVPDPDDFPQGIVPIRLVVPRLDLDAPVVATALDAQRIQGPPVAGDVAWLEQTRRPGEIGPAILGGVARIGDDVGAFARLEDLVVGDEFAVGGEDGDVLHFRVEAVERSAVADRADVFRAGGPDAQVRLVRWAVTDDVNHDLVVTAVAVDPEEA